MTAPRAVLLWLCMTGCSGGGGAGADAGSSDAGVLAPPAPPAVPEWPCPSGWREVVDGDLTTCDPFQPGGALDCAVDEAHFPGEPGCSRIGTVCPAGEWPEGLPAGRPIIYVRAGGAPGGDGTQLAPYGTVAEALAAAPPAAIVALGKGTFDEALQLGAGLALWGACVAETRIASSVANNSAGTINVTAAGTEVHNLQVGGARVGVWVTSASANLLVEDVVVANAADVGLFVLNGASVTATSVAIRDTQVRPSDGAFGIGLDVEVGAQVALDRAVLERNRDHAVYAYGAGTTVALTDVVLRDTAGATSGQFGRGIGAEAGAHVDLVRGDFERNREQAVYASGAGTAVTLTDVVVRDTLSQQSDGLVGLGLEVRWGARADVTRATFERNRTAGVTAVGVGAVLTLTDVVVRDTLSQQFDGRYGGGLAAFDGAHVEATRAAFARNRAEGVFAAGTTTTLTLTDVIVRDTMGQEDDPARGPGLFGRGLEAQGARVDVTRALFERNRDMGVFALGAGTAVVLVDVVVRDTLSQESDGVRGRGLGAQAGARVEAERALFERNRDSGVYANDPGTTMILADVAVRDTSSQESDGRSGRGLGAQWGARIEAARVVLEGNRDLGLYAFDPGTIVIVSDLIVRDTRDQECEATSSCPWRIAAHVGSYESADISITRFLLSGSVFLGVQLALGGTVDLHEGEVSANQIGANVQTDGFDTARLQDRVTYRDNDINFDGSALDTPDSSLPAGP